MAARAKKKPAPAAVNAEGADDLLILHPDQDIEIDGRSITVREYGFVEGLQLTATIKPFVDDLHALVAVDGVPPLHVVAEVIGNHANLVRDLIAQSCDVEVDWVAGLNDQDGSDLMYAWWAVCAPFFLRRVFDRIRAAKAVASLRAGQTSTQS